MIDHVSIGVSDLARSAAFYDRVLGALGVGRLFQDGDHIAYGRRGEPYFIINPPLDPSRGPVGRTNGLHLCFTAATAQQVRDFHRVALENGAIDDGGPGLRPQYTPTYYAAFVLDPDGHKIEAHCNVPDASKTD